MIRTVTITLQVDATEYEAEDTPQGVIDLVFDMLKGDADLPEEIVIACEDITQPTLYLGDT